MAVARAAAALHCLPRGLLAAAATAAAWPAQHAALAAATAGVCSSGTAAAAPAAASLPRRRFASSAPAAQDAAAVQGLPEAIAAAVEGPALLYRQGLESGAYRPDPLQQVTVTKLQRVFDDLRAANPAPQKRSGLTMVDSVGAEKAGSSWLDELSTLIKSRSGLHGGSLPAGRRGAVRGLYMYGGVGCGKTMLMDLLVASAPREFQVQRTHFHDFMLDIHRRLRGLSGEADPLRHVADDVAAGIKVLALDELFVTDVADAMILHRLFGRLWEAGLVLVATSNRAPDALYENGLQRQLFLPFIDRLKEHCVVHNMNSPVDYRRLAHHTRGLYFLTPDRTALLHAAFLEAGQDSLAAAQGAPASSGGGGLGNPGPRSISVAMGRQLTVPQALGAAALFDFDELCARPLAAADYIALATTFSVVAVADVPRFGPSNIAAGYRFVTLVDVLYEHRVKLLVSAEGTPFELFERIITQQEAHKAGGTTHGHLRRAGDAPGAGGISLHASGFSSASGGPPGAQDVAVDDQLGFAKDRAISRLTEMQSAEYQVTYARAHAPQLVLALEELQQRQRQAHAAAAR